MNVLIRICERSLQLNLRPPAKIVNADLVFILTVVRKQCVSDIASFSVRKL